MSEPRSEPQAQAAELDEQGRFTIHLEQREGYQIDVRFDWKRAADLLMDEPPPLGETAGPNASRLLAAAAANCLSASLLYCLSKDDPPDQSLRAEATCILVRNARKRLRIGRLEVRLIAGEALTGSRRFERCKGLFEDFCVVSASIRDGIPIAVEVVDEAGNLLHRSD
jgi:organic hydroperoxide reductase OsmC/OhrA